jgi:hypothetical protein
MMFLLHGMCFATQLLHFMSCSSVERRWSDDPAEAAA